MRWNRFWTIHRWAYWFVMWTISIKCAILGAFCLFAGFQQPLLLLFVPPCLAGIALVNPWLVRLRETRKH